MAVCHIFRLDFPNLSGNPMQCRCSRSESSTMQVGGFRVCRTFLCSFLFHFEPPGRMSWTCDLLAGKTTKLSLSQSLRGLRTGWGVGVLKWKGAANTSCRLRQQKNWRLRESLVNSREEVWDLSWALLWVPFLLLALLEPCDLGSGVNFCHDQNSAYSVYKRLSEYQSDSMIILHAIIVSWYVERALPHIETSDQF